uniref:Uncharacterized protein n=1 Tax=Arundo donax TaxID=35708 RepID=A0A0A9BWR8_ARUDO
MLSFQVSPLSLLCSRKKHPIVILCCGATS